LFVLDYYRGGQPTTHAETKPAAMSPATGREQIARVD
jgi:hypothetical protein